MPPWTLPLPGGVNLALVLGANGAAWSQAAGWCRWSSVHHPLTIPWEQLWGAPLPPAGNVRTPHTELQPPARLTGCGRQDSDGLQHLHIFPGRKCQVLQGSVGCQQRAGQDLSRAGEWVTISNERCRRREGESRVPPPSLSASSIS